LAGHKLSAAVSAAAAAAMLWSAAARAEPVGDVADALARMQTQIDQQADRLARQEQLLAAQKARIESQDAELRQMRALTQDTLAAARGTGTGTLPPPAANPFADAAPAPIVLAQVAPVVVGEPPPDQPKVVVASVPESQGVLTPRGQLTVEPQVNYQHGSTNRLVFRGVEILPGVQIGAIDAGDADRNTTQAALDLRYGLTDRLQLEALIPWMYRVDRVTTLDQYDEAITHTDPLHGSGLGDIELSARYQLNAARGGDWPVFIAGLRVKTNTGSNPFTIDRDAAGAATELATGSGFWGIEPSLSFLLPSDPIVLFGGISYLHQFSDTFNKDVGGTVIGKVEPGGSINANLGFGFAVNPRFSFSTGYKHTYVFPTRTWLDGEKHSSTSLQVGQVMLGWSYALSPRLVLTNTYAIGTTRDAPDMEVTFRLPVTF
jgi:hypothetical protein